MNAPARLRAVYGAFGPFLKPYRGRVALAFLGLGASVGMTLLRPWPVKLVLDVILLKRQSLTDALPWLPASVDRWSAQWLLAALCLSLIAIVLLESLFGYMQKVLFAAVGQSATTDVLEHAFTHLQTLPRSGAKETRTGDVMVRLTSDVKTLRDLMVNHQQKFVTYGLTFVSTVAVMAWMNWRLTLLGLAVVPLVYVASYRFALQIRAAARRKRTKEGEVASIVQETLDAMPIVQAFSQEDEERRRFRAETRQTLDAALESSRLGGAFTRSVKVLNSIGTAVVVWFGASRVLEGQLSPGDLVVFVAYVNELYVPVQNLSELAAQFMESLVSGERVMELLKTAPRIKDSPHAVKAPRFRGEIRFEDVTAAYDPGCPVLRNVSFCARAGQKIALVGESGAGKSTVVNLLLRFLDPAAGRILIDEADLRRYTLQSLRRQIAVVLQEAILFRRTVRENIAYGKPGSSSVEIEAAAVAARAHEFIERLPRGYDTVLDERGGNLSGGERQRIALARAFLRDAPVLVLDEPVTGLDAVTEAQLIDTLEDLARNRTTFVVAHKLASVANAGLILVLDRGELVEQGAHEELLARDGVYRRLYDAQGDQSGAPVIAGTRARRYPS
jgi:ATP-binding cassette subfamily B protein